jgi:hypothetical protein
MLLEAWLTFLVFVLLVAMTDIFYNDDEGD